MALKPRWKKYKGSRDTTQHPGRIPNREVHDFAPVHDALPHISNSEAIRDESETWRTGWYNMAKLYRFVIKNNQFAELKLARSGFGQLLALDLPKSSKRLCGSLAERWWDTTHTFQFTHLEIGITPLDLTFLTGIAVGTVRILPYADDLSDSTWDDVVDKYFSELNFLENKGGKCGGISTSLFREWLVSYGDLPGDAPPPTEGKQRQLYHVFVLWMIGSVFFPNSSSVVRWGWLHLFDNDDDLCCYDWGSAILARLYIGLDTVSREGPSCEGMYESVNAIDTSGVAFIKDLKKGMEKREIEFVLVNPVGEVMEKLQQANKAHNFLGMDCLYLTVGDAVSSLSSKIKGQALNNV